jgi:hypothetical protein
LRRYNELVCYGAGGAQGDVDVEGDVREPAGLHNN